MLVNNRWCAPCGYSFLISSRPIYNISFSVFVNGYSNCSAEYRHHYLHVFDGQAQRKLLLGQVLICDNKFQPVSLGNFVQNLLQRRFLKLHGPCSPVGFQFFSNLLRCCQFLARSRILHDLPRVQVDHFIRLVVEVDLDLSFFEENTGCGPPGIYVKGCS